MHSKLTPPPRAPYPPAPRPGTSLFRRLHVRRRGHGKHIRRVLHRGRRSLARQHPGRRRVHRCRCPTNWAFSPVLCRRHTCSTARYFHPVWHKAGTQRDGSRTHGPPSLSPVADCGVLVGDEEVSWEYLAVPLLRLPLVRHNRRPARGKVGHVYDCLYVACRLHAIQDESTWQCCR